VVISAEQRAEIRRLFFAEHWKIGTIATALGLHAETVRAALETERFNEKKRGARQRKTLTAPYVDFLRETLKEHPRLRATRLYEMIRARGYRGSVVQLRRVVRELRPRIAEAYASLRTFPGEQAQVDWAHFGQVEVGRAKRRLSCFLMVLSYSRALYVEFFFDQTLESLLRGHVRAFRAFSGVTRVVLYDNLRSVVLERRGDSIRFHPRLLELVGHYHFQPRPCHPGRGNEKGRVERAVRFVRESFFAARPFTTLRDFNHQAWQWCEQTAQGGPWPEDRSRRGRTCWPRRRVLCCRCRSIPSTPTSSSRSARRRRSTSASISTTTRFHPARWAGR
jgi:transposase